MSSDLHTTSLLDMLTRYREGDATALDELLRRVGDQLERLASRMLRGYPIVRDHEQTRDVLHNALLRLATALRTVRPTSTVAFFGLTATHLRRELLDLARYYRRRAGVNQPLPPGAGQTPDPPDRQGDDPDDLDRWQALHEAVERLPPDLRAVFDLSFYHDQSQADIARSLGGSVRQVRRQWRAACLRLNELLGDRLPPN